MFEQDYILRLAAQLAAALQRIFRAAAGQQLDEALREVDGAYGDLLGLPPGLLDRLDVPGAVGLLASPARIRVAARLSLEEGRLHLRLGRVALARPRLERALGLYDAALARAPGDAEVRAERDEAAATLASGPSDPAR